MRFRDLKQLIKPKEPMNTSSRANMRLASGQIVNVLKLTKAEIRYWDFAWSLHRQCRYGGHTPVMWDVLSHSALVWNLARRELQDKFTEDYELQAGLLLHDAGEGYLCDLPRPIKHIPEAEFFVQMEEQIQRTIFARFGIHYDKLDWETIKRFDDQALFVEMSILFPDIRGTRFMPNAQFLSEPSLETMRRLLMPVLPKDFERALRSVIINVMQPKGFDTSKLNEIFEVPECLVPYIKDQATGIVVEDISDHEL